MSFQPTENTVPSATASSGWPSCPKMSFPWWYDTSARGKPYESMYEDGPYTGNT
jgi:hypothetical protein